MSIFGLFGDVAKIVLAPVEIVTDVAQVITKPIADLAEELVDEIKDLTK